jgi:hypothetical protein
MLGFCCGCARTQSKAFEACLHARLSFSQGVASVNRDTVKSYSITRPDGDLRNCFAPFLFYAWNYIPIRRHQLLTDIDADGHVDVLDQICNNGIMWYTLAICNIQDHDISLDSGMRWTLLAPRADPCPCSSRGLPRYVIATRTLYSNFNTIMKPTQCATPDDTYLCQSDMSLTCIGLSTAPAASTMLQQYTMAQGRSAA